MMFALLPIEHTVLKRIVKIVDVPLERGHPYSRFVYHKGNSHEQIAKRVLEVMMKCPKSFLPSISDTASEKWYYW